ncbi:hypothetical protein V6U78_06095 [Marinospirillum sp. MEB164]|uniref:Uncharacterized protein n=1 Tax=Marinospirillum alkalitolerans TaxID=3123374 RepID=A0ABW8PWE2_9GAMM
MQLPDFTHFAPFQQLRKTMGARRTGHFELFDPHKHLTGQERSQLDQQGRRLRLDQLRALADGTWAYKNTRLAVYRAEDPHYHLAQCPQLSQWGRNQQVWVSTRRTGKLPLAGQDQPLSICPDCLQFLGYKGFDLKRNRKIAYSKKLLSLFSREEFYIVYPLYPVQGIESLPLHSAEPNRS